MKQRIQWMRDGLFFATRVIVAIYVQRERCDGIGQDANAGEDRGHLHGAPLVDRLPGGGSPEEEGVGTTAQGVLGLSPCSDQMSEGVFHICLLVLSMKRSNQMVAPVSEELVLAVKGVLLIFCTFDNNSNCRSPCSVVYAQ